MADTLVIDHDGIYDPSLLNDRLLLGLNGTMSEFEISLLRQRAMEARRQKVGRGLVLTQVPVGYVRTEDEGIEKTPDRQVQEAIAGIFRKFRELGLLLPLLARPHRHAPILQTKPVDTSTLSVHESKLAPRAVSLGALRTRQSAEFSSYAKQPWDRSSKLFVPGDTQPAARRFPVEPPSQQT
jgi:hypothetical protein